MSARARLRVAVVGCGIGGPAAALFLARNGHRVTLFERAAALEPRGAGILLSPIGLFVLRRLGLLDEVCRRGSRIERLVGHTDRDRQVLDIRYGRLTPGLCGVGIHRGALFSSLREAIAAEKIEIRSDWHVVSADGGFLRSATGQSEGPFDLIVAADGARSALRRSLGLESKVVQLPYAALWCSLANWGEFPDNVLLQTYRGTRRMLGLLPSGHVEGEEGRRISLFWSLPHRQVPLWRLNGLDRWRSEVAGLLPGAESLMEQIQSTDQVTVATAFEVRTKAACRGECALVGDSAHAMSPQLGQGASLALFDAMVLADCVERESDVPTALRAYDDARRRHVRFYRRASRLMTSFFQSDLTPLAFPRDLLLGPLCRWPWLQREMVATAAGLKDGLFSRVTEQGEVFETAASLLGAG